MAGAVVRAEVVRGAVVRGEVVRAEVVQPAEGIPVAHNALD
jgi:hypothetical protein